MYVVYNEKVQRKYKNYSGRINQYSSAWRKVIVIFNIPSLISMLQFNIVNHVPKSNVNFTTCLYSNVSCAITSINGQTAVLGLMAIGSEK